MARTKVDDASILEAALIGLEHQHRTITEKIGQIRKQLGIRLKVSADGLFAQPQRKRRKMSAAARKRIGDRTRKRWAAYRKAKAG